MSVLSEQVGAVSIQVEGDVRGWGGGLRGCGLIGCGGLSGRVSDLVGGVNQLHGCVDMLRDDCIGRE